MKYPQPGRQIYPGEQSRGREALTVISVDEEDRQFLSKTLTVHFLLLQGIHEVLLVFGFTLPLLQSFVGGLQFRQLVGMCLGDLYFFEHLD